MKVIKVIALQFNNTQKPTIIRQQYRQNCLKIKVSHGMDWTRKKCAYINWIINYVKKD